MTEFDPKKEKKYNKVFAFYTLLCYTVCAQIIECQNYAKNAVKCR